MLDREFMLLLTSFRRLLRRNATSAVKKMIRKTHPADLAEIFRSFTDLERETIFDYIEDVHYKAELITELDDDIFHELLTNYATEKIKDIIMELPGDDQADVLEKLPDEIEQDVINLLNKKESREIDELLKYSPESAGGLMVPLPFKLHEDCTAREAVETVQSQEDMELVFYIYIVDQDDRLTGVLSLRELLSAKPNDILKNIMRKELITVKPGTDQEKVARIVSRYDFLAIPVVDEGNHLLGIVTIDDIIDVLREEATEDFLQMAGVGKDREILLKSPGQAVKMRFPWLFATFMGGVIASLIVMQFETLVTKFALLSSFIPIIAGMGGNVGIQSSTIIVRGISTGRINLKKLGKVISRQMFIGLALGLLYGTLLTIFSMVFYSGREAIYPLAGITGFSLLMAILIAATVGTVSPLILDRLKIDPAVATGPIVTTSVDILSVAIYLTTAFLLLMNV